MNSVTVNYSVNQSYSVTESAFIQMVEQCINDTNFIKLEHEPRIIFAKNQSNVSFIIDVRVKKNKSLYEVINSFTEEFEKRFISLLDIKPESLKVCFFGYY
ncbi:MMB_0454 family protein [Mycoplasmopsis columbina]|uniref:MMB_0454 family protein n=1 Tax=Mycoplasmopsis columbina TaxID=114881 RepID=UPI0004A6F8A7|nr:hypothetical protein [Mycoplasmopsis columbina]VEU76815.1 Uncharacterised protein [Mycoplasmopsis columbina]